MEQTKRLKDVYKICTALLNKREKDEVAFFMAVRSFIMKTSKAFFDVLTADPEVISSMEDDILITIAKELTKTVKENMCPAWHERKQAQAKLRLLKMLWNR